MNEGGWANRETDGFSVTKETKLTEDCRFSQEAGPIYTEKQGESERSAGVLE
jgi:hypothetical protein